MTSAPNIFTMSDTVHDGVTARRRSDLLFLLLYVFLAVALFHPLNPLNRGMLSRGGIGDPAQMVWFLGYTPHAIAHGLNPWSTNLIDYPTGVDLASNTSVPLLGIILAPITTIFGPAATLNLLMRLGPLLAAASLLFVLRRYVRSGVARGIGALLFGFGPYIIGQEGYNTHINLLILALFPPMVLFVDELLISQRWSAIRAGLLLGLFAGLEMLIAPELLSDFAIVIAITLLIALPAARRSIVPRLAHALRGGVVALIELLVISGYQIYELIYGPQHIPRAVYSVAHLQSFHNSVLATLLPTSQELLSSAAITTSLHLPTQDVNELGGYIGVPLLVALVLTIALLWRNRAVVILALGSVIAWILSLGSTLHIGGSAIPLPEQLLIHLPLLKSTVPDRFVFVMQLGIAIIVAIGVDRMISYRGSLPVIRRWPLTLGAGVLLLAIMASLFPRIPISERPLVFPANLGTTIARSVTPNGVVLTYPYPSPPLNQAMLWQAEGGFTYHLLGAYATVPKRDGNGEEWPILQHPSEVQSYLTRLAMGARSHYPKVATPLTATNLCGYAARVGLTDVVIVMSEVNAKLALSYLERLPHTTTLANSTVTVLHLNRAALHSCS